MVFTPRAKSVSPTVGARGVGVAGGTGVADGALVGVSVTVGSANTKAFIGTATATACPSGNRALRPI